MASSICFPATFRSDSAGFLLFGLRPSTQFKAQRMVVRSDLDRNVSDMRTNAPKGLFPPEPEHYRGPKLKVAIIGAGLAGMSTAVELLDQGHEVDIYESRPFIGGKVGSFVDRRGNHIEMGLHVFFGCYNNLFRLMKKVGADKNLLVKDHTHTFVNKGGEICELDFRFPVGAPLHGINAFLTTNQLKPYDKARNAVALALSPVVRALIDPDGAMRDIRNLDNISFSEWFLSKGGTRKSIQRMWDPVAYALGFIDCDNMSARCMLTIFSLFATKTEASLLRMLKGSPDVYLSGPIKEYITQKGGRFHLRWGCREILYERSADGHTYVSGIAMSKVLALFPSSQGLEVTWSSVVKIGQSLYREGPGKDPFRPDQKTPVGNFFLAGSYTKQDYIDSMEGATLSGRQASAYICDAGEELVALQKKIAVIESNKLTEAELSLV